MFSAIKNVITGIGTQGLLAILAVVLPLILGLINVSKYGSILDNLFLGFGVSLSLIFQTRLGEKLERIIEFFIIKIVVVLIIFPILSFVRGMRKDDKVTLEMYIEAVRDNFKKMLQVKK